MSEKEIAKLRDRIEQLEMILGIDHRNATRLRLAFKIQPGSAEVLGMLMNRTVVAKEAMYQALYGLRPEASQPCWKSVDVVICKLRRALTFHNIEIDTVQNIGYLMRPEHKARVREVLENFEKATAPCACPTKAELSDFPAIAIKPVSSAAAH